MSAHHSFEIPKSRALPLKQHATFSRSCTLCIERCTLLLILEFLLKIEGHKWVFEAFVVWFEALMVLYRKGGIFTEKEKVKDY